MNQAIYNTPEPDHVALLIFKISLESWRRENVEIYVQI